MKEQARKLIERIGSQYGIGTEPYEVCLCAVEFLGRPYTRTEELAEATIDCSTLTSQSYWEGALVGIPFIAESQRVAGSGVAVRDIAEARPSDVLIRYASLQDAPDQTYNHVGLYLGTDGDGRGWVVESRGGQGSILTPAEEFPPLGGIQRFILDWTTPYLSAEAIAARELARYVPKLGRVGARQYLKSGDDRPVHRGLDIYLEPGTEIVSPSHGWSEEIFDDREEAWGIQIVSSGYDGLVLRLFHLERQGAGRRPIRRGDLVGTLAAPRDGAAIRYVESLSSHNAHRTSKLSTQAKN